MCQITDQFVEGIKNLRGYRCKVYSLFKSVPFRGLYFPDIIDKNASLNQTSALRYQKSVFTLKTKN